MNPDAEVPSRNCRTIGLLAGMPIAMALYYFIALAGNLRSLVSATKAELQPDAYIYLGTATVVKIIWLPLVLGWVAAYWYWLSRNNLRLVWTHAISTCVVLFLLILPPLIISHQLEDALPNEVQRVWHNPDDRPRRK